jgi:cobalt-zinc-cadmium efflux system protein
MRKTVYLIRKMDCPSEEQWVTLALAQLPEKHSLVFDLTNRRLTVFHGSHHEAISSLLAPLNFGHVLLSDEAVDGELVATHESRALWVALGINVFFFVAEALTGYLADSMGLLADSLDMLADAFVYGISLLAVGAALSRKMAIAKASGYIQALLGCLGFAEVVRRFMTETSMPDASAMMGMSALALIGNAITLWILRPYADRGVHMQASVIFTSSDVLINAGVILSGLLVLFTGSMLPDLTVGVIVFSIVTLASFRIIRMARLAKEQGNA